MAGRPVEPVPQDIADQVVAWISEGKTLREFCRQEGKPVYSTVYDWMDKDQEFATRIARAREIGQEVIHQECLSIADTTQTGVIVTEKPDGSTETKTADMIEHRKLRIDTRLKLLAKWNPKKYGDRMLNVLDGEVGIKSILVPERIATERSQTDLTPDFGESSQ